MLHRKTHVDTPHIPAPPIEMASVVLVREGEVAGPDKDGDLLWCSQADLSEAGKVKAQEWLDQVQALGHEVGDGLPEGDVGDHLVVPWTSDE